MGGRQVLEAPTDGRPGWKEEVYSAYVEGEGADAHAVSKDSGRVVLNPGLGLRFHVD